jgi:hypothetical protein
VARVPDTGAVFHIEVGPRAVACRVDLPGRLELDETGAAALEANLHDVLEGTLARYFPLAAS